MIAFELNENHRLLYAEKLLDLGNLAVGGLVFGQFLSEKEFSKELAFIGLSLLLIIYLVVYFLIKKERKKRS